MRSVITPNSIFKFELLKVESNEQIAERAADKVVCSWTVPEDLPYLAGHFPNQPVVPAVAIIDAALEVLSQGLKQKLSLQKVKNAKFTSPLLPGTTVQIEAMKISEFEWSVDFKGEQQVAKILLSFVFHSVSS